jgi:hypothetical protein
MIANYSLPWNTESTELQKIICEMKTNEREWLKVLLLRTFSPRDMPPGYPNYQL